MSELDKLIVRSWSAVVARGLDGTAWQVATETKLPIADVAKRLTELRLTGRLP